jgi:hypothetical protein
MGCLAINSFIDPILNYINTYKNIKKYFDFTYKSQELCDVAILSATGAIKYVSVQYMTNNMCKTVVTRHDYYAYYLDHNGYLLEYIPIEKQTFKICNIAVNIKYVKYVKNKKYKLYNSTYNAYDYVKNYVW